MSTDHRSALLLINPNCRQGKSVDLGAGIRRLEEAGIAVRVIESESPEQSDDAIAEYHERVDFVIVAGGDGTISSSAQSLHRYQLPLAILPLGTANDLARSLGIPGDLDEAFELIAANHRHRVDLGRVNGHCFFNACHIGLAVSITHRLTPEVKRKWGVLSYLKASIEALARRRRFSVHIDVDGEVHHMKVLQLTVGNGRYYGGGNIVDEESTLDDGLLHLSCIYPRTLWELLVLAPLIRLGKQRLAYRAFCTSGRHIRVSTRHSMTLAADGEPVTRTPLEFEVLTGALEVFIPPQTERNSTLVKNSSPAAELEAL